MKRMIVDTPNLLFRVFAMNAEKIKASTQNAENTDDVDAVNEAQRELGFCLHVALSSMLKHFKKHKPDQVAVVFEGRQNWRKAYTLSDACVSKKVYKGNRVRDASMDMLFELIDNFRKLVSEHTSIVVLQNDYLEGDDLIAGYAQRFSAMGDEVVIISGDKDFMQLYRLPNVSLINPDTGKDRRFEPKHKDFDAEWYLFEKCVRGDGGDNVPSAYPRCRTTKIRAAFEDEYARTNLFNETWKIVDHEDPLNEEKWQVFRVGDLVAENKLLVDLFEQPTEVRSLIDETLDNELANHGKWNMFHFLRFCGKYGLNQVAENVSNYADMFAATGRFGEAAKPNKVSSQLTKSNTILETTGGEDSVDASDLLKQISDKKKMERTAIANTEIQNNLLEF